MDSTRGAVAIALAFGALLLGTGCAACARTTEWSTGAVRVEPREVPGLGADVVVIDLRPGPEYAAGHLPGAIQVGFADLNGFLSHLRASAGDVPVLLACEDGIEAALAWPTTQLHGFSRAWALGGGVAAWRAAGMPLDRELRLPTLPLTPPELPMTRAAQVMNVVAGLVIKPTYMLMALAMVLWLRKVRRSIAVLWHGLLWFFVGEAFCALNLAWHLPGHAYFSDVMHGVGMAAMSALIPWGFYAILDERVVRFSDPAAGCRFQSLCGRCWKRDPVRCGFHDLMLLALVALAVVSLIPLSGPLRPIQVVSDVLGTRTDFGVPVVNLFVELRVYPVLAFVGFLVALAMMARGGTASVRRATPVFFAALGMMAYSLLRFLLSETFRTAFHWTNLWEELTEFFMVVGIGAFLYFFRSQLGLVASPAAAPAPAPEGPAPQPPAASA